MSNRHVFRLTLSGLLIAIGILIPMFSPIKIILEPASFTLASHVPIFIAMFISPAMAISVAAGTTLGFLFGGFPFVIVLRAATHLLFSTLGSIYIKRYPDLYKSKFRFRLFSFIVALIHSFGEIVVSSIFYFTGKMSAGYYQKDFVVSILLLVGLGTLVHSMFDFELANIVMFALRKSKNLQ